jgi:hypothetical protein
MPQWYHITELFAATLASETLARLFRQDIPHLTDRRDESAPVLNRILIRS